MPTSELGRFTGNRSGICLSSDGTTLMGMLSSSTPTIWKYYNYLNIYGKWAGNYYKHVRDKIENGIYIYNDNGIAQNFGGYEFPVEAPPDLRDTTQVKNSLKQLPD